MAFPDGAEGWAIVKPVLTEQVIEEPALPPFRTLVLEALDGNGGFGRLAALARGFEYDTSLAMDPGFHGIPAGNDLEFRAVSDWLQTGLDGPGAFPQSQRLDPDDILE